MIFTAFLLGTQHKRDSVEKSASLLIVSLAKKLSGMSPSLRGRQMAGPSRPPVVMAQFNQRQAKRADERQIISKAPLK